MNRVIVYDNVLAALHAVPRELRSNIRGEEITSAFNRLPPTANFQNLVTVFTQITRKGLNHISRADPLSLG
jgi:hypothetical protein